MNDMSHNPAGADLCAEQRRIDRNSLRIARAELADAKARRLPISEAMFRRDVQRLTARLRRAS